MSDSVTRPATAEGNPFNPWIVACPHRGQECDCNGDPKIEERMRRDGVDVKRFNRSLRYRNKILLRYCLIRGCSVCHNWRE